MQLLDGMAVRYYDAWVGSQRSVDIMLQEKQSHHDQLEAMQRKADEADVAARNYANQVTMLTEHAAKLSATISEMSNSPINT
jgi:hypothetical protein